MRWTRQEIAYLFTNTDTVAVGLNYTMQTSLNGQGQHRTQTDKAERIAHIHIQSSGSGLDTFPVTRSLVIMIVETLLVALLGREDTFPFLASRRGTLVIATARIAFLLVSTTYKAVVASVGANVVPALPALALS